MKSPHLHIVWILGLLLLPRLLPAMPRLEVIPADFATIRDPLVPPGYEAPSQDADPGALQLDAITAKIVWPSLRLRGITHTGQGKFIAMIDQIGIVEEGDEIRMRQGVLLYTWRVDKIDANGLISTRLHVTHLDQPHQPRQIPPPPAPAENLEPDSPNSTP